ncbi:MAG: O-antigen ligase family protein [Pseudomonadota bacterium]
MATRLLNPALRQPLGARRAAVLALALPVLFLHAEFQPTLSVGAGSTTVDVRLSDLAVAAVVVAAAADGRARGFDVLRAGRWVWAAAGGLVAWVVAAALYGPLVLDDYPFAENLVTAAKFAEYALLAPAIALLVRSRDDLRPVALMLVAWSAIATAVGLLQLAGLDLFDVSDPGRQRSFLGHHDFAALSGAALLVGLALLVLEDRRRALPLAAGAIGLVLAAPLAGVLGLALAVAALLVVARALHPYPRRRAAAAVAAVVLVAAGTVAMRSETLTDFVRFLSTDTQTTDIESYSQRTLLLYIGARVFLDHPLVGVGLRGSEEPAAFEPYLADARERFPDASPLAFPSPERKVGVQSLYVQSLADLGIVGGALLVALLATALALARRAVRTAAGVVGLLWLLLCVGLWGAQGLVAGVPLAALTWFGIGLLVSGAAEAARA